MVEKKPDWLKKNVMKSAKFQTAPISLSIDPEINHHLEENKLRPTELFREFICLKSGKKLYDIERILADKVLELIKLESRFLSKDFRKFCINKIKETTTKPEIKKRMEEKEKEE
jgi:hypothetical protein